MKLTSSRFIQLALLIVATIFFLSVNAQDSKKMKEHVSDPSLVPLTGGNGEPAYRWRMYGDINKDGFDDIIVSETFDKMSQNGLNLFIYFADSSGKYIFYDTIYTTPGRLLFERDRAGIRLWEYWHAGGGEAIIGYSWLTDSGLMRGASMTVYAGDGGGKISNAVCDAMFHSCDVVFRTETYQIVDGKVVIVRNAE